MPDIFRRAHGATLFDANGLGAPTPLAPDARSRPPLKRLAVLLVVLAAALWLPYGFAITPLIEAWDVLARFERAGVFFVVGEGTPMPHDHMRPFTVLPHAVAYWLDPDGFAAWNALLFGAAGVKVAAMAMIGWWLTRSGPLALWVGAMALLYPADTMQFSFRSLHIQTSLALMLAATACVLWALETRRAARIFFVIAASVMSVTAYPMYEASLMLVPLPGLLVLAREGWRGAWASLRARWPVWLVWVVSAGACVAYMVFVYLTRTTYQGQVIGNPVEAVLANLPALFTVGLTRALASGWYDAARIAWVELRAVGYPLVFAALVTGLIVGGLFVRRKTETEGGYGPALVLLGVGVLIALLGYAPFLTSYSHIHTAQRTFLFASVGGMLFWFGILWIVLRVSRPAFLALVGLSVFVGLTVQLFQMDHYDRLSERQRALLAETVTALGPTIDDRPVVIRDETARFHGIWMLPSAVEEALIYLYARDLQIAEVCILPEGIWPQLHLEVRYKTGLCAETPSEFRFIKASPDAYPETPLTLDAPPDLRIARDTARVVTVNGTPARIAAADVPPRARHALAPSRPLLPLRLFDAPDEGGTSFVWEFTRWWDYEAPVRGFGWSGINWELDPLGPVSRAWQDRDRAQLRFTLDAVEDRAYALTATVGMFWSDATRDGARAALNGIPIPLTASPNRLEGAIPDGALRPGDNTLTFSNTAAPGPNGVRVFFDRVEVAPAP